MSDKNNKISAMTVNDMKLVLSYSVKATDFCPITDGIACP